MPFPPRPSKQEAFLALLGESWTSLHLDARRPGVIVPAHLRGEAHLVLQYGHDFPIPIPDLEVDEYGVRATLSFAKTPHLTVVPWSAVYIISCEGRGVVYQEDVPEDVQGSGALDGPYTARAGAHLSAEAARAAGGQALAAARKHALRSVPADATPEPAPAEAVAGAAPAPRRRRRPQLRLVK
jgi:stringent starvation protein B